MSFKIKRWHSFLGVVFFFVYIFTVSSWGGDAKNRDASSTRTSTDSSSQILSSRDKISFYRWMVDEMYEQVMIERPKNSKDLDGWINIFAQGASVEGVYHGLILSTSYAAKETGTTTISVLRWYSQELEFMDALSSQMDKKVKLQSAGQYVKEKSDASFFTLKKEFGERILREIELRKNNRKELSKWFATLASRWAKLEIDFGLTERNKREFDFHEDWAMENSVGLLQWEILNRVHRIMNQLAGLKVPTKH